MRFRSGVPFTVSSRKNIKECGPFLLTASFSGTQEHCKSNVILHQRTCRKYKVRMCKPDWIQNPETKNYQLYFALSSTLFQPLVTMTYPIKQVFSVTQLSGAAALARYSCPRSIHATCFGGHSAHERRQNLIHNEPTVLAKNARFVFRLFNDAVHYMCYTSLHKMRGLPRVVSCMQESATQCLRTQWGEPSGIAVCQVWTPAVICTVSE
jgi:hypothetical protein